MRAEVLNALLPLRRDPDSHKDVSPDGSRVLAWFISERIGRLEWRGRSTSVFVAQQAGPGRQAQSAPPYGREGDRLRIRGDKNHTLERREFLVRRRVATGPYRGSEPS
jgi:hypothetical protein